MDGQLYIILAKTFGIYESLESNMAATAKECGIKTSAEAAKISRETDNILFLKEYSTIFAEPAAFEFEASGTDTVFLLIYNKATEIVADQVTNIILGHKLGLLINQDDSLGEKQVVLEKEHAGLAHLVQVYTETPSFGSAASPMEVYSLLF